MRRFSSRDEYDQVLGVPRDPEDLPEAEPIHPGHTLIRPSLGMLKSAVKFPQKDNSKNAVYGNIENFGITYGKTPYRVRYTGFRKRNELVESILDAVKSEDKGEGNEKGPQLVIIKPEASYREQPALKVLTSHGQMIAEEENNANEILDVNSDEDGSDESGDDYRRQRRMTKHDLERKVQDRNPALTGRSKKKLRSKFRDTSNESELFNNNCSSSSSDSSYSSDSSDEVEKNEGNPYTVHKDKYKQNWMWNHFDDYRRQRRMTKHDLERKVQDRNPALTGRSKKKLRSKFRDTSNESELFNNNCSSSSSDSSYSSDSSDEVEKNEGNPYTVHKDKYKQNWMWNHFMDGDHMNINPYGPQFNSMGPTGADLFFGRKWWYFNQDDYKPFR